MANHFHLLLVVDDPDDLPRFMGYLKKQLCGGVNQMIGCPGRVIWDEGYDSPIILDNEKVMDRSAYLYANPSRAHLEDSIDKYPGVSSWKMFSTDDYVVKVPWLRPEKVPYVGINPSLKLSHAALSTMEKEATGTMTLTLSPWAWKKCVYRGNTEYERNLKQGITSELRAREQCYRNERGTRPVVGAARLITEPLIQEHHPKRNGKKMICLGSVREERAEFIDSAKRLVQSGREVFARWKRGERDASYPLGLFPPGQLKRGNLLR